MMPYQDSFQATTHSGKSKTPFFYNPKTLSLQGIYFYLPLLILKYLSISIAISNLFLFLWRSIGKPTLPAFKVPGAPPCDFSMCLEPICFATRVVIFVIDLIKIKFPAVDATGMVADTHLLVPVIWKPTVPAINLLRAGPCIFLVCFGVIYSIAAGGATPVIF